ncbi:hypothetical protein NFI96_003455, partial [Prochilodus magdalenae]
MSKEVSSSYTDYATLSSRLQTKSMPRTKASRRSAVAKKRMADQRGGPGDPAVALTDEVMPLPSPKKVLTDCGPVSYSPPLRRASARSAASVTDGVTPHPHDEKALSDGSMPFAHNKKALAVRGSFHQAHPRFGCNSNKQCVANGVTSIMTAKVKNVLTWTMRDLDDVLLNGDRFYSSIRDAGRIHDPSGYLFVRDLPTEHALHGYEFELSYSEEMFTGLFGVHEYGDMQDVFMSHDVALRTVLTRFDECLFTVKVNTCAIVKRGSWYVIIDSHARNLHGEVDEDSGKSLVAYHANIESLLSHITILGLSLQAEQEQFEVTGVTVNVRGRSAMQQHGNASGGQNGVHGPVVCVPSNITDVTETLPRSENVDLMIRIKLKRKLTYKGHYEYKFVNPDKIKNALLYLKEHNPFYRDVQFNNDWVNPLSKIEEETLEQDDASMQNGGEANTDENNEAEDVNIDETLHDRQQHGFDGRNRHGVTSEMLRNKDAVQEILNYDEGYKFLRPVRGTPAFWQNVQKDLFAMVRQLGIPTWFCSFSSADLRWPELMESILRQEGRDTSPDELDWSERCSLLKINPVTAARMFDHRFRCFLKDVIMSEAQPIGKIVDYFYRVEFQQRGSPHVHCLFWVENAPQVDKNDDDEVVAFVDRFVTCEMPSEDDTEIYEIVSGVQRHSKRHSKSCKKRGTPCRFNFPRPPSSRTFITRRKTETGKDDGNGESPEHSIIVHDIIDRELAEAIVKKVKDILLDPEANFQSADDLFASMGINQELFEAAYIRMTKKTTFVLKRKPCDVWVNQYNRELLRCWNANMDIQFVVDAYSCIVYIISYISKAEREIGLLLSRTQKEATEQGNLDAKQALRKLGSVFLHNREVSAQESVYRLTNMTLKEASRKVQFIPTGDNVVRMSLPLHIIQTRAEYDDNDNQNIWMNSITDRYKCRPETEQFSEMCLARFASEYRILSKSESSSRDAIKLEKGLGHVRKRTRTDAAVVRYARFSPTKHPEKHYQSILQLFLPHYMDCELKPSAFNTYEEFYKTGFVKYSDELCSVKYVVDFNMSCFEKDADTIDEAEEILKRNGLMEDAWAQICPESEQERLECVDMKKNETTERQNSNSTGDIPDLLPSEPRSCMQKEEAMNVLRSLNEQQSEIFYKIRDWCLQKTLGANPEPFRVFISGPGGVGKSMLIKAIYYESSRILSRLNPDNPDETHVLLTAPTGVSAFNIDAATIHNCFSIGTDVKLPYQPLGDEKINSLRAKMGNLQIVIIDEISMVDHKLLAYVHGRLRQIKQPGDYSAFGNVSVIAVGDFYQLAPVKGKSLYTEPKGVNLWQNHFALAELTCIMRQKDMKFAQLLSRLRKRNIHDKLLDEDLTMLKQCEAGDELDGIALYIHATNAEVDLHNTNMLKKLCSNNITIHAKDFERVAKTGRLEKMDGHHVHVSHTSLPESLHIGVNARVMLVKNIDVADGLVNGAFGSVTEICFDADDDFPSKIYVTFENERIGKNVRAKNLCLKPGLEKATPIQPEEERVTKSGGMRRQFPLKLAWACTVHKVQGLTVEKCVVSLKNIFAAGQAYVALSRVTSLEGLKIKDFKESAIYAKQDIELSLQSMPQFIEQVKEVLPSSSSCKILLHNIEGLMSHVEDLRHDKRYMEADIICMTETWLKSNYCIDDIQLCEFSFD